MDADTNICAVILNYNDAQTTMKLTESWKNSKVIRNIIIVDNCSTDDSWEKLGEFKEEFASDHPDDPDKVQLHLFRTTENGGYGSGNQAGIDYAVQYLEPDYIIIANPDVQVSDACILRVADALEKQEDGAVASAMVVDVKGTVLFQLLGSPVCVAGSFRYRSCDQEAVPCLFENAVRKAASGSRWCQSYGGGLFQAPFSLVKQAVLRQEI